MSFQLPASVRGFHDYYKLTGVAADLLEGFGYEYASKRLELPKTEEPLPWLETLRQRLEFTLEKFTLNTEISRREFLIAPILFEIALHYGIEVRSEYDINVSSQLKGTLDYLVRANGNLIVIEAKLADMTRGFTQLSAELVALDKWTPSDAPILYGAVTVGNIWQFGALYRQEKKLTQDVHIYTVPDNLEDLLRVLIGILLQPVALPTPV